jgi:invasion protein IalB
MKKLFLAGCAVLAGWATPVHAQQATFKEKQGDWSVYAYDAGAKKICFTVAQPRSKKPTNVKRDPVYFYVSNWPKAKVTNEISVKMGYPLKPGVPAEIKIGDKKFAMFTKAEGAYVEKAAVEQQVVAAMKAGTTMVIQGRSTRGTLTTDEYSLVGISKALETSAKACK